MSPPEDLLAVVEVAADLFDRLQASYALGGAVAQNVWGVVRATQDVDFLVAIPRIRFEALRQELDGAGFMLWDDAGPRTITVEAIVEQERDRHLVVLCRGLVKVEIFFPFLPLQSSLLRRAQRKQLGNRSVPITSAEDMILLKMAFHREKDLRDVRGILWSQKGKLDLAYIREWAGKMLEDEVQVEIDRLIKEYSG